VTRPALPAEALTTGAFYGAFFLFLGAHLPFWPIWFAEWGLSAREIGQFASVAIIARVAGGVIAPAIADRLGAGRVMLGAACLAAALLFAAHALIESRAVLLLATLATAAAVSGAIPIGDALAVSATRRFGFDYARARAAGSVAFILANLVVGWLVARMGVGVVLWWVAFWLAAAGVLGWIHPGGGRSKAERERASLREAAMLFRSPVFLAVAAASALTQASHGVYYAYGSVHWRAQGYSEDVIGALWAFAVIVEVGLMVLFGGRLVRRIGPIGAMALGAAAGLLRWPLMALDPPMAMLWPVQALHALTFAAAYLGMIAFIAAATPTRLGATAQGLIGAGAGGVVMAAITFAAAEAYVRWGGGAYLIGAASCALGLTAALWARARWDGGEVPIAPAP